MLLFDIRSTHYSVGLGSSRQDFMETQEGVEHSLLLRRSVVYV